MELQKSHLSFNRLLNFLIKVNAIKSEKALKEARRIYLLLAMQKGLKLTKDREYMKELVDVYYFYRDYENKKEKKRDDPA